MISSSAMSQLSDRQHNFAYTKQTKTFEKQQNQAATPGMSELQSKSYALNLDYKLTAESRRRVVPSLKRLYDVSGKPGVISLAGGMPNPSIFPFDKIGANTLTPPFAHGVAQSKLTSSEAMKFRVFQNYDRTPDGEDGDIELSTSLQYGEATGDARLRDFMKGHVDKLHNVKFEDWDVIMTVGNTCAWDLVLRTFCEPSDVLLFEEFTFPTALENAQTRGCECHSVDMDERGIDVEDLRNKARKYHPKLLYLIPTGQNPTGTVLPADRRARILEVAEEFDFLVVEDEPYYYLQHEGTNHKKQLANCLHHNDPVHVLDKEQYASFSSFARSLLEFDTHGRVIRMDSFSKIMAPGIRLGWITCQQRFSDAIRKTMEISCSKPSGFAQSLVYGVLRRWGQHGLYDWLSGLRKEYTQRRDICCQTLIDNIEDRSIKVQLPEAGMFFWLTMTLPHCEPSQSGKLEETFFDMALEDEKVVVVPGRWCKVDKTVFTENECTLHFRGTFASESRENLVEGAMRLAAAINAFVRKYNNAEVEVNGLEVTNEAEPFTLV